MKSAKKMPVKKAEKKEEPREAAKSSRYFTGVGRRKRSIARVKIAKDSKKRGAVIVNGKELKEYLPLLELSKIASSPLDVTEDPKSLSVTVKVSGGGIRGQAEAIRLGLARALVALDREMKKSLRDLGYLTRDDRIVERKKAGLKKARRAPQWKKR